MKVKVDFANFNKNLQRAQFRLDTRIMNDMVPYMPMNTGTLINLTRARSISLAGSGIVCAAAEVKEYKERGQYGRFQYYGKVMVDPNTNSPWAKKDAKKVVTERPLNYSNPNARPKWFEVAKEKNLSKWVDIAKKEMGGG